MCKHRFLYLVQLVVQELAHLMVLRIDNQKTLVVCGEPHPPLTVKLHVPHLQFFRQTFNLMLLQVVLDASNPLVLLLELDEALLLYRHPDISLGVD